MKPSHMYRKSEQVCNELLLSITHPKRLWGHWVASPGVITGPGWFMHCGLWKLVTNSCASRGMAELVVEGGKKGSWWSLTKKFCVKLERPGRQISCSPLEVWTWTAVVSRCRSWESCFTYLVHTSVKWRCLELPPRGNMRVHLFTFSFISQTYIEYLLWVRSCGRTWYTFLKAIDIILPFWTFC